MLRANFSDAGRVSVYFTGGLDSTIPTVSTPFPVEQIAPNATQFRVVGTLTTAQRLMQAGDKLSASFGAPFMYLLDFNALTIAIDRAT